MAGCTPDKAMAENTTAVIIGFLGLWIPNLPELDANSILMLAVAAP
jgi:hypothetical protein